MGFLFHKRCIYAKLCIFSETSKKYFAVVYAEDAAVADFAALAGGKQLNVAPTSVKLYRRKIQLRSSSMLPSDFLTCKSMGSPLFNMWRAVEI